MIASTKIPKFFSGTLSTTYPATTTFQDLSAVPVGTGINTRTGSAVHAKYLDLNMLFVIADTYNVMRVIVFEWFPSDTSDVPGSAELYSTAYSAGNNEQYVALNPVKPSRFRVLQEFTVILDVAHVALHKKVNLRLKGSPSFDTGVNTGKNHIYVAIVSDSTTATHPTCAFSWTFGFEE